VNSFDETPRNSTEESPSGKRGRGEFKINIIDQANNQIESSLYSIQEKDEESSSAAKSPASKRNLYKDQRNVGASSDSASLYKPTLGLHEAPKSSINLLETPVPDRTHAARKPRGSVMI